MKKLLFLFIALYSQVTFTQDILHLSTGQTIKCKIIDTLENGSLKLELKGGKTSVIHSSLILSHEDFENITYFEFPRYRFIIETGRYNHNYGSHGIMFNMSHGVDLTPLVFGGVNLGYRSDQITLAGYSALTLSADFRFFFSKGTISPYIGAAIGGVFYLSDYNSIFVKPSFGTAVKINNKIDFVSSLGYEADLYMDYIYFNVGASFRL